MRILFVGVFDTSRSSHHPMLREFRNAGNDVDVFSYREEEVSRRRFTKAEHTLQRWLRKPRMPSWIAKRYFRLPGIRSMNAELIRCVESGSYDLMFMAKAERVDYHNIELFNRHTRTWYYFMDPLAIARTMHAAEYAARSTYSSASRKNVADLFSAAGGSAILLTQGTDLEYYYPDGRTEKEYDIVFVGRLKEHRPALLTSLHRAGIEVTTFGPDGENPAVYNEELGSVYRKSRIILALNSAPSSTGFSRRLFQAMGTGSMVLAEYCSDLELFFKNGRDLVWFTTPEECAELIQTFLADKERREKIAKTGSETVRNNYTWKHIIGRILEQAECET